MKDEQSLKYKARRITGPRQNPGELLPLSGRKFGRWKVIRFSERRRDTKQYMWACVCECGTERDVCGARLRNGTSKSCGCIQSNKHLSHFNKNKKRPLIFDELE